MVKESPMSFFSRIGKCRRPIGWTAFALLLVGLGWALHAWLPPQSRWVVRGAIEPLGFAQDGETFCTQAPGIGGNVSFCVDNGPQTFPVQLHAPHSRSGPVQFWDVKSGREIRHLFDDVSNLSKLTLSRDGRLLATLVDYTGPEGTTHLRLVDVDTGRASRALILPRTPHWAIHYSPGNTLLLMEGTRWLQLNDGWVEWNGATAPEPALLLFDTQSLRLVARITGEQWRWRWAPDGEALLLYSIEKSGTLRRVTAQAETSIVLDGAGDWLAITPDGKTLLTAWPLAAAGEGPGPSVLVWDTATGKRRGEIPRRFPGDPIDFGKAFLANGRTLVLTQEGAAGEAMSVVWDLDTHMAIGRVPQENRRILVSAEHNVFVIFGQDPPNQLALYRPQPLAQLWQRDVNGGSLRPTEFLDGTKRLLAKTGDGGTQRLELFDIETGEGVLDVGVIDEHRVLHRGRFLAVEEMVPQAHRHSPVQDMLERWFALVFRAPSAGANFATTTRLFDTETGAEQCRLALRGATLADLSADGQSIFMYMGDRNGAGATLSCYDVPPRRYWPWIIGMPLVFGALLLLLCTGWGSLRRRWAAPTPAADAARFAEGAPP
jgi:WD40 repeat protein